MKDMKGSEIIGLICEWADKQGFSQSDLLNSSVATLFNMMIERDRTERHRSIKEWYVDEYPSDEYGQQLKEGLSFKDLYDALGVEDIYEYFGIADTLVRERIFSKVADIMNVSYAYIYDEWLG